MSDEIKLLEFELAKYKAALKTAGIDTFDINFNTGEASQSSYITEKLGYTPEEVDSFEKRNATIYPSDLHESLIDVEKLRKGEIDKTDLIFRIYGKDGKLSWVKHDGVMIEDPLNGDMHFVGALRDITNEKLYLEKLTHLADFDSLTGAYNRRKGLGKLENDMKHMHDLSVLFMDVDNFKTINDQYGHIKGDKLLKLLADNLQKQLLDSSYLIRMGGDEFLIVFSGSNEDLVMKILNGAIAETNAMVDLELSISKGYVKYNQSLHTSMDVLIHEADQLMYLDKASKK